MTPEEAKEISKVMATADGGCSCCAKGLAEEMKDVFPAFDWEALVMEAGGWTVEAWGWPK